MKQWYRIIQIVFISLLAGQQIFAFSLSDTTVTTKQSIVYPVNSLKVIPGLNFKDTDARDILRSIAYEFQCNIIVDNSVRQKVSIALFKISVFDAVRMIAEDNGLLFEYDSLRMFVKSIPKNYNSNPLGDKKYLTVDNGKLDISIVNYELGALVSDLQKSTGRNFLITSGVSGSLTGTLNNIDLNTGLTHLFGNNGFEITLQDSVYYISSMDKENNSVVNFRKSSNIEINDDLVSLNLKSADINRTIDEIANRMNLHIMKLSQPSGKVTINCQNFTVDEVLDLIFTGTKYTYKNDNGIYIIGENTDKNLNDSQMFKLNYLRADKLPEKIPSNILQGVLVKPILEHNAVVLSGSNDKIKGVKDYIRLIDQPIAQVMIEALVIDYNVDKLYERGLTLGTGDSSITHKARSYLPGMDLTFSGNQLNDYFKEVGKVKVGETEFDMAKLAKLPENFYMNLRALEEDGIANVRSRPMLSALNGHKATMKIGTTQSYVFTDVMPISSTVSTQYIEKERIEKIEANIAFELTPWVGPNNELTLEIKPDFQTPVGEFSPDKLTIPAINTRTFESTIRLKDGETIILGGLIQDIESNSVSKFPILGDIPFLDYIFKKVSKKKSKVELVIYLTPRISYGNFDGFNLHSEDK